MDDQAVIDRLRSDLQTQRHGTTMPDADRLLGAGRRRWHRRRARRAIGLGVAATVLLAGIAAVAAGSGDHGASVRAGPSGNASTTAPSTAPSTTSVPLATTSTTTTTFPVGPPSQTPEEAGRDGVPTTVAELPLAARLDIRFEVATPEGRWAMAEPRFPPGYECTAADCEWSEVVLLDTTGAIVRSFPTAGATPSWLDVTDDAVLGGRIGDGGQPWSTLFRIDRTTLTLRGQVFGGPELPTIGVDFLPVGENVTWAPADDGTVFGDLVGYGPDAVGRDVDAGQGGTIRIDEPAIDALLRP